MNTWLEHSKVPEQLQKDLAEYGLLRDTAKKETGELTGTKFFGLSETTDEYKLTITDDIEKIDSQYEHTQLAIIAPDNETFDMLEPKDFSKKLKLTNPKNLRKFLLDLVNSV